MLVPKLVTTLRNYTRAQFTADLTAGLIVGIVALPLAIAFAIASGVTPDRGLWTAIIAGFLISALGGSRVQIGGPTGAFVVIVYGIVQQYGVDGLLIATIMAGLLLVALGLTGLGNAVKFIPYPVVIGFTSGIALIIFSSQVKDLLGLRMGEVPADFLEKWAAYLDNLGSANPAAIGVAALALGIILLWPRVSRRIPGPFVALVVTTLLVRFTPLDVETIGSRFGSISASLPSPSLPDVDLATVRALVGPALAIALLGAIESLLSAVVADGMIGGKHRSNMELVAQGVANVVTPVFGGIPATGAIARTATNVRNGGRTPVAGMVHAVTLLLITLFFGRLAAYIPFATLGAILVVVSWNMSEAHAFRAEFRGPKSDILVMLSTFGLTVLVDLSVAIQVGMVLATFLFMKRMSEVTNVQVMTREFQDNGDTYQSDPNGLRGHTIPPGVEVYEINGPFFFGAAKTFKEQVESVLGKPKVLILRMRNVPAIDSTGLHALREMVHSSRRAGTLILLSDVHSQPMVALGRSHLLEDIGEEAIIPTLEEALARAREHLAGVQPVAHAGAE
ncbi:MAG TPA: sulfate permease [Longimicrobiales bacterium]|nr:sulfate permease [Longimicrobiales bacterium]